MAHKHRQQATRSWTTRRDEKKRRMQLVSSWMSGPLLPRERLVESLEALIAPADRIVLEGDNQKQADFLSRSLVKVDPKKLQDLHLIISSISRPEHLALFELGIAKKVDFAFAGPQSLHVSQLLEDGQLEIGAIHTYVELFAAVAGVSPVGQKAVASETAALRKKGVVAYPEDIGVQRLEAKRSLLAARSIEDLVAWSGGLYSPPARFRSW